MTEMAAPPSGFLSKQRLEALSDGVFAVALTLLVLELKLDRLPAGASNDEVWRALRGQALPFLTYAVTFLLTGNFWVLQHRQFLLLTQSTPRHTGLTLAFLFGVTLLPLSVSIGLRPQGGAGAAVYFANMAYLGGSLLLGWLVARRGGLVAPDADPAGIAALTRRTVALTAGCAVASPLSLWRPEVGALALVLIVATVRFAARRLGRHP